MRELLPPHYTNVSKQSLRFVAGPSRSYFRNTKHWLTSYVCTRVHREGKACHSTGEILPNRLTETSHTEGCISCKYRLEDCCHVGGSCCRPDRTWVTNAHRSIHTVLRTKGVQLSRIASRIRALVAVSRGVGQRASRTIAFESSHAQFSVSSDFETFIFSFLSFSLPYFTFFCFLSYHLLPFLSLLSFSFLFIFLVCFFLQSTVDLGLAKRHQLSHSPQICAIILVNLSEH